MVEARIITKEQHELIDKLNVSRITGLDGDDHDLRQSLKNEMPERLAEMRVKKNNPNPKFDEVMTVSCLDARKGRRPFASRRRTGWSGHRMAISGRVFCASG